MRLHYAFDVGRGELAAATGAWIGYGQRAEAEYPIRRLADGEHISLGDVTLEILDTPGHTPESISVTVFEHGTDTVPYGVLTGDALFIGDVGRPDLLASTGYTADELARMLRASSIVPVVVAISRRTAARPSCRRSRSRTR